MSGKVKAKNIELVPCYPLYAETSSRNGANCLAVYMLIKTATNTLSSAKDVSFSSSFRRRRKLLENGRRQVGQG